MCRRYLLASLALGVAAVGQQTDRESDSIAELQRMMDVQVRTATLRKQSLQDAPASVTVITSDDIHRYGYRTLGEVLSNVRSFYTTSDSVQLYEGVRGFSLPGDYNTRLLLLLNGHQLTDNVYASMYSGDDFPLDMDLVDQIEIVRGPSSALYGSNGLFATVNVITKTPANAPRQRVSIEGASFGRGKLAASSAFAIGREAKVLISASGLRTAGRTATFPELAEAGFSVFRTDHADAENGYHAFANLLWRNWSFTAMSGLYKAIAPTGWFATAIGDTGTSDLEGRDYFEAAWSRSLGQNSEIGVRAYYDRYRYDGVYVYTDAYRNWDGALGDWIGSQITYQAKTSRLGNLTLGAEAGLDLRNVQYNFDIFETDAGPVRRDNFRISQRRRTGGLFVQDEIPLGPAWTAYLGGRIDDSTNDSAVFSPRVALVHKRNRSAYKLMYGKAFRNPSTYERYWMPNPALQAECIHTVELAAERSLHRRVNLIASVFHYRLGQLIEGVPVAEDTLQFQNTSRARATGVEAELNGHPADWLETAASVSFQRTRAIDSQHYLPHSPARLAQWRASVPLAERRLVASAALRYIGPRLDSYGDRIGSVAVVDLTLTAPRLHPALDLQLGIRNLLNTGYSEPMSPEHTPHRLPARGRNFFVKLTWRNE